MPKIGNPAPITAEQVGGVDPSGLLTGLHFDADGFVKVNVAAGGASGGTSSSFGATFPATGTAAGAIDSTGKMAGMTLDASGYLKVNVAAGGAGGGAVTVANGDDVAEGATTDASVTGDNTGTVSAKLRGLNKILADVWNSVSHFLKVEVQNASIAVSQSGVWSMGVSPTPASTPTQTSVASSASNGTLLAANSARLGATFYNDADKSVFVKLGTTASATSFTAKLLPNGYYEVPFSYTGRIDAIWDTGPTGSMRITELTA